MPGKRRMPVKAAAVTDYQGGNFPVGWADVAPDGSPVTFYRGLPAVGEPELIHAVIAQGASGLDLGCGAGRIAGPLAMLGHPVTGVDNGPRDDRGPAAQGDAGRKPQDNCLPSVSDELSAG